MPPRDRSYQHTEAFRQAVSDGVQRSERSQRIRKQHQKIRELYLSGLSTSQVSKQVGLDRSQVYRICKDIARPHVRPDSTNYRTLRRRARTATEVALGRTLKPRERTAVLNGDLLDLRPSNLVVQQRNWTPEVQKKYMERYREKRREEFIEKSNRWRSENPERFRVIAQAYRQRRIARIASAPGRGLTTEDWKRILRYYENKCLRCGNTYRPTMDHVIPLSRGGAHDPSNIQPLCKSCNTSKFNKTIDYRLGAELMSYWFNLMEAA